jgi:hypothetical protein
MAQAACEKHGFEFAEAMCRRCGHWFCSTCLVYAFGQNKPPYCVSCAILAAGVRSNAGYIPRSSGRQIKREIKAQRKAERAATKASRRGHPVVADSDEPVRETGFDAEVAAWKSGDEIWEDAARH